MRSYRQQMNKWLHDKILSRVDKRSTSAPNLGPRAIDALCSDVDDYDDDDGHGRRTTASENENESEACVCNKCTLLILKYSFSISFSSFGLWLLPWIFAKRIFSGQRSVESAKIIVSSFPNPHRA